MYSVNQLYLFWIWILKKNMTVSLILIKTHNSGKWSCLKNISVFCFTNSSNEAVMWTVPCFSFALCICRDANLRKYVEKVHKKKKSRLSNRYKHYIMFINSAKSELVPQRGATKLWSDSCRTQHCIFWVCNKGVGGFKDRRLFWNTPFHFSPFLPPNSIWEFPAGGEKTLVAISPSLLHFFSCGFPPARFY